MSDIPSAFASEPGSDVDKDIIQDSLKFVREHLGMDVAYLSEFIGEDLIFRAVDAPGFEELAAVGDKIPLEQVYCRHILNGKLPELIPDTSAEPIAMSLPITAAVPIKAHVSVPIRRLDGSVYGMFCCLSQNVAPSLNGRDLNVLRAFANLSAEQINSTITTRSETETIESAIQSMLKNQSFKIALQPIMGISKAAPVGFEALTRFRSDPYRPPNVWFEDAQKVGMQVELELCVIASALETLNHLPEHVYLSVNASPKTVQSGQLGRLMQPYDAKRIVLEVTEHEEVEDMESLLDELIALRATGMRLAVDDAGAGYSGLQQIIRLQPDIIKLDISLTTGLDKDVVRRSLASALVGFANETNAKIVAEGIETDGELQALADLGVPLGQGYLLGKPADLKRALSFFETDQKRSA